MLLDCLQPSWQLSHRRFDWLSGCSLMTDSFPSACGLPSLLQTSVLLRKRYGNAISQGILENPSNGRCDSLAPDTHWPETDAAPLGPRDTKAVTEETSQEGTMDLHPASRTALRHVIQHAKGLKVENNKTLTQPAVREQERLHFLMLKTGRSPSSECL